MPRQLIYFFRLVKVFFKVDISFYKLCYKRKPTNKIHKKQTCMQVLNCNFNSASLGNSIILSAIRLKHRHEKSKFGLQFYKKNDTDMISLNLLGITDF